MDEEGNVVSYKNKRSRKDRSQVVKKTTKPKKRKDKVLKSGG